MDMAEMQGYRPTKKRPLKKRHTKPCKYFLLSTCPKTAEECDFSHVLTGLPTHQKSKACRYFLAGNCINGVWCSYMHISPNSKQERDYDMKDSYVCGADNATWAYESNEYLNQPVETPSWPVYTSSQMSPIHGRGVKPLKVLPNLVQAELFGSPYISPSTSRSSSVSGDMSHRASTMSMETDITPPPTATIAPVPAWEQLSNSPTTLTSYYQDFVTKQVALNATNSRPKRINRSKAASYKSKVCRYYKPESGQMCPNGNRCTFIHDASEKGSTAEDAGNNHGLPQKPLSPVEESRKKGFYPITWRVIGGGVLMGNAPRGSGQYGVKTDVVAAPSSGGSDVESSPSPSRTPRARANSIPSTPITAHVDMQTLFSAESPGGL